MSIQPRQILVIECVCGTATFADRESLVQHPSREIVCSGLTRDHKGVCGRVIPSRDALRRLDRGEKVWVVKENETVQPSLLTGIP